VLLPSGDFADEALGVVDSAIEALPAEHADLDLDHVEPAGMLGGVMELQASQNSPERPRGENVVDLMEALRRSVGGAAPETKAPKKSGKKLRKAAAGNELTSAICAVSVKAIESDNVAVKAALLDIVDLLHEYADVHGALRTLAAH
jgi:hypothetical protein